MTGTFSRLEERKSTETFRKSNGGKRVHSALQMEKEYRRKMVISFMDHNMFHSFGHVTLAAGQSGAKWCAGWAEWLLGRVVHAC